MGNAGDSGDTVDVRESVKLVILGQRVFFLGDILLSLAKVIDKY